MLSNTKLSNGSKPLRIPEDENRSDLFTDFENFPILTAHFSTASELHPNVLLQVLRQVKDTLLAFLFLSVVLLLVCHFCA